MTYSATGLPTGATFSALTQVFDWTPGVGTAGTYNVTFSVSDGSLTDSETVTITVGTGGGSQTMIFYPSAGDGYVGAGGTTWDAAHDAASGTADGASANSRISVGESGNYLARAFLPFDTSALPDNATIVSAELNVYVYQADNNDNDGDDWVNVIQTTQGNAASLAGADFSQAGAVNNPIEGAARIDMTTIPVNAYTKWVLNSTGLGWINKTGASLLGLREGHDALDSAPLSFNRIKFYSLEQGGTAQDPYLEVTYTITGGNQAPVLNPIGSQAVNEGVNLNFTISGTDPDGDALTYSATGLPVGATFDLFNTNL